MKLFKRTLKSRAQSGFTLPAVLMVGIAALIIGLSITHSSSSIADSLQDRYYKRLSKEAAEAGIAYATYCLEENDYNQTWGPANSKPNLTQLTDCNGDPITGAQTNLLNTAQLKTGFSVGDLETRQDGALVVSVSGSVSRMNGSSASVLRSFDTNRKQLVRWQSFDATKSFSGFFRTCGIISGSAWCWGVNDYGQLGLGSAAVGNTYNTPQKVIKETGALAGKTIKEMATGHQNTCALTTDGEVYCWGRNNQAQIGQGSTSPAYYDTPQRVGGALLGKVVTSISSAQTTNCAIAEGKIYCWGNNAMGNIGDGTTTRRTTPTLVSTTYLGSSYTASTLASGGTFSQMMCAIVSGSAWCWGSNEAGQLGIGAAMGDGEYDPRPRRVAGLLNTLTVTTLSFEGADNQSGINTSVTHTCATASGKAYCWGGNYYGMLGNNSTTNSNVPVAVRANSGDLLYNKTVVDTVVGSNHSCALTSEPKVYCWGRQVSGQLGNGVKNTSAIQRLPVAVVEQAGALLGKTVTAINGGANRACAVAGKRVYCWGENGNGQLGDGTFIDREYPTEATFLRPKAPMYIF